MENCSEFSALEGLIKTLVGLIKNLKGRAQVSFRSFRDKALEGVPKQEIAQAPSAPLAPPSPPQLR